MSVRRDDGLAAQRRTDVGEGRRSKVEPAPGIGRAYFVEQQQPMSRYRVQIVDDHPIVLTGLRLLLTDDDRFEIAAEATTSLAARLEAERLRPDIIIADLVMGDGGDIALIQDLQVIVPGVRIIVYSSRDEMVWAPRSLEAGARGYVEKSQSLSMVATALEAVASDETFVSPRVRRRMRDQAPSEGVGEGVLAELSARERQVLHLMGSGATLQNLARELGLSVKTVGTYRERLKVKLGLDSTRMLERYAADFSAGRIGGSV
jgi:DNA-binding NarL/FixJ family response regulator